MAKMKCDVAIIGSGIGGMCCAAELAHAGFKVAILEKAPVLGGRYTSMMCKGNMSHTGAHVVAYGYDSPHWLTIEAVGAPKPEVKTLGQIRYTFPGMKPFDLWMDKKGGMWALIEYVSRSPEEFKRVMSALKRAMRWQEPSDTITFKEWISQYTDNENIHGVFQTLAAGWSGLNIWEYPAGEFVRCLKYNAKVGGFFVPQNGLKDIIDSLEQAIKRDKGEILSEAKATRITVQDGAATGVIVERKGEKTEVEARVVVSNVGPIKTFELAGEKNFDKGYLKEVRETIRPAVGMMWDFVSDKPLLDFEGILYTTDTKRTQAWVDFSGLWPHWAPKGKRLTSCFVAPPNTLMYDPRKEHEIFLQDANYIFPDMAKKGAKLVSIRNYCGNWPVTRSWQGVMMGVKTSIENLYNVGDSANPPGYIIAEGASQSGRMAAELIKGSLR